MLASCHDLVDSLFTSVDILYSNWLGLTGIHSAFENETYIALILLYVRYIAYIALFKVFRFNLAGKLGSHNDIFNRSVIELGS